MPNSKFVVIGAEPPKSTLGTIRYLTDIAQNKLRPTALGGVPREWVFFLMEMETSYLEDCRKWAEEGEFSAGRARRRGGKMKTNALTLFFLCDGWVYEGKFTCNIDSMHEWDQEGVFAAYARLATNKAKGKVVIRIGA